MIRMHLAVTAAALLALAVGWWALPPITSGLSNRLLVAGATFPYRDRFGAFEPEITPAQYFRDHPMPQPRLPAYPALTARLLPVPAWLRAGFEQQQRASLVRAIEGAEADDAAGAFLTGAVLDLWDAPACARLAQRLTERFPQSVTVARVLWAVNTELWREAPFEPPAAGRARLAAAGGTDDADWSLLSEVLALGPGGDRTAAWSTGDEDAWDDAAGGEPERAAVSQWVAPPSETGGLWDRLLLLVEQFLAQEGPLGAGDDLRALAARGLTATTLDPFARAMTLTAAHRRWRADRGALVTAVGGALLDGASLHQAAGNTENAERAKSAARALGERGAAADDAELAAAGRALCDRAAGQAVAQPPSGVLPPPGDQPPPGATEGNGGRGPPPAAFDPPPAPVAAVAAATEADTGALRAAEISDAFDALIAAWRRLGFAAGLFLALAIGGADYLILSLWHLLRRPPRELRGSIFRWPERTVAAGLALLYLPVAALLAEAPAPDPFAQAAGAFSAAWLTAAGVFAALALTYLVAFFWRRPEPEETPKPRRARFSWHWQRLLGLHLVALALVTAGWAAFSVAGREDAARRWLTVLERQPGEAPHAWTFPVTPPRR